MDYNFDDILNSIATTDQKWEAELAIDEARDRLFKGGDLDARLLAALVASKIRVEEKEEADHFLEALRSKINSIRVINIVLALEPSDKILEVLKKWGKENYHEQVIFDVTIDPRIVAGAIIISDGQYFDESLVAALEAVFEARKEELVKPILNN